MTGYFTPVGYMGLVDGEYMLFATELDYHNKTFKAEAEARDLEIGYDRTVGFSHTSPTDAFKKTLEENGFVLEVPFARVPPKEKAKAEREKPHRYVCPICGQEVKTTADLSLICGVCEVPMSRAD